MLFQFLQLPAVIKLFDIFDSHKIEARFVGGVVRDELLYTQKSKLDFDIAVACDINIVFDMLSLHGIHCITTNILYKTIIAIVDDIGFEITELREDEQCYGRSCTTKSTTSFEIDAKRRDFTINALYLDRNGRIYDYFNAIDGGDIRNRTIRFIGDAKQRITEDYLRILRYYRFCAIYNDQCNMYYDVINETKGGIAQLSIERIRSELLKILDAQYCIATLKQMHQDEIFKVISLPINSSILQELQSNTFNIMSLEAKLYLLFGTSICAQLKLSKQQKKNINMYNSHLEDNLEYVYYKNDNQYVHDIVSLRHYLCNKKQFYKITPQICNVDHHQFSQKLLACERWYVSDNYKASLDDCISYIKTMR